MLGNNLVPSRVVQKTPDKLDASIDMLRAQVAARRTPEEIRRDARKRSEVVARIAKCEGPVLDAVLDAVRVHAPDAELDRLLRTSA